jgi:ribosomal protein S18 acetylase RimI-like enzyme
VLRGARPADAPALARIHAAARQAAMPGLVEPHDEAAVAAWLVGVLMRDATVLVAEAEGRLVGYIGFGEVPGRGAMVLHLYLDPSWRRRGLGSALLARARAAHPAGLSLFAFARNQAARAFYAHHGFRAVAEGDASANEEGEPDVLLSWAPGERNC